MLGAGAGLAAGSQLGKGLGKGLADLLNMNEDEAGGLGEMLLGAAGAYIGSELGGAVGEEIAGELAKQFFQTGGFDSPTGDPSQMLHLPARCAADAAGALWF